MSLALDHIVITVADLDAAMRDYEALGFTVRRGGVHANRATENALVVFQDGTYLELLAKTGEPPLPGLVDFSTIFERPLGLAGYALRADDLEAEAARLRGHGFAVGEIIAGERRRADGVLVGWKLALIDGGFSPFLIEDVTPRELRIPTDPAVTTHANRALGVKAVETVARDVSAAIERISQLLALPKDAQLDSKSSPIWLGYSEPFASQFASDEVPDHLKLFRGSINQPSQAEIDAANPVLEPIEFHRDREWQQAALAEFRAQAETERAIQALLKASDEGLLAVHLVREADRDERFTLERTHGVRFRQLTAIPPTRGQELLPILSQILWDTLPLLNKSGGEIPDLLRALTSESMWVRENAMSELYGLVLPEYSPTVASVELIPIFMQLLDVPAVKDRSEVIRFIESIVLETRGFLGLEERVDEALRHEVLRLRPLLLDADKVVRTVAAYLLQVCGDVDDTVLNVVAEPHLPPLRTLLRDPSPDVRLSAVRFFAQRPELNDVADVLEDMAANDPSLTIRVAAADVLAGQRG